MRIVFVTYCQIRNCRGKKLVFSHSFNLTKCIVVDLLIAEWLFNLLFCCECGFNQYAGQKSLIDVSRENILLLKLSCFRKIVLSYIEDASSLPSEISCLLFCSVQYKKNKNKRGGSPLFSFPKPIISCSKQVRIFV